MRGTRLQIQVKQSRSLHIWLRALLRVRYRMQQWMNKLLSVGLTFCEVGKQGSGPGLCGMMRETDKQNKPAGQMEKTPPHIYIAVQFPDAKDKRASKQDETDNLQSNEN